MVVIVVDLEKVSFTLKIFPFFLAAAWSEGSQLIRNSKLKQKAVSLIGFEIVLWDEEVYKSGLHLQRLKDFHLSRICKTAGYRKANAEFSSKPVSALWQRSWTAGVSTELKPAFSL